MSRGKSAATHKRAPHCWALRSNFWPCAPRLVEWPSGVHDLPAPHQLPTSGVAATLLSNGKHSALVGSPAGENANAAWPMEDDSRWKLSPACQWRSGDSPGSFNKEAEVALGLALYTANATAIVRADEEGDWPASLSLSPSSSLRLLPQLDGVKFGKIFHDRSACMAN